MFVGGKPLSLLAELSKDDNLKLLSIPHDQVQGPYLAASLSATDYPALVAPGQEVPTVAVGAVLAAYNWNPDNPRSDKVTNFVNRFFDGFDTFLQPPYHPKWQEVDIRADLPGWQRLAAAQDWLATHL